MVDPNPDRDNDDVEMPEGEKLDKILKGMDTPSLKDLYKSLKGLAEELEKNGDTKAEVTVHAIGSVEEIEDLKAQGLMDPATAEALKEKITDAEDDEDPLIQTRRLRKAFSPLIGLLYDMYGEEAGGDIIAETDERVGRDQAHFDHLNKLRSAGKEDRERVESFLCEMKLMLRLAERMQRDLVAQEQAELN